jgi:uncharacterized membrane protein
LLLAGAAKIAFADSGGWPGGSPLVRLVLPPLELITGALLIAGYRWAGIVAGVLLAVFTAFLVFRLARHSSEPCRCFGEASNRPVSPLNVVRNVVLLGAAVAVTAGWDLGGLVARVIGLVLGVALVAAERGTGRPPATTVLRRAEDS